MRNALLKPSPWGEGAQCAHWAGMGKDRTPHQSASLTASPQGEAFASTKSPIQRITALICVLVVFLCLFSGCGGEKAPYVATGDGLGEVDKAPEATEVENQSLTMTYYRQETLNPLKTADYTNRALFSLLYQGLFAVNREYQVEPVLCKQYTMSQDMKTYTFYVDDATFSDGTVVTAQDVTATLKTAVKSQIYKGRFTHVNTITLLDDGGIEFRLDTPYENFPLLLDVPIIPEKDLESDRPAGTGPYLLDESGGVSRLRRRSDWWCSSRDLVATSPSITLQEAESNTQIRDNFQFGDVNLVCADPGSDKFADYRCDFELWNCENGMFLFLACSADSGVFSDDRVRIALTHAIDRDAITDEFYRGYAKAVTLPASPQFPYYNQNLASKYGYDPQKFKDAVAEAGKVDANVTLLVNSSDSMRVRVARAIAENLEAGGLTVTMKEVSGEAYDLAVRMRSYDLYLGQTVLSPNMDLSAFFHTYGALSFGGINDVTAYSLCLEALANYGNYYSLYKYVMENGKLCPVLFRSYAVFASRGVATDLKPARDNIFCYSIGKTMEEALLPDSQTP